MKKEDAVRCSTPILKTLLYSTQSDAPTQFFSYTGMFPPMVAGLGCRRTFSSRDGGLPFGWRLRVVRCVVGVVALRDVCVCVSLCDA
jgi:hypothetical protein